MTHGMFCLRLPIGDSLSDRYTRRAVRMGQHVWLLLATVGTELLVIIKWSRGQFPEPLPTRVKWAWAIGVTLLVLYPTVRVSTPPAAFWFLWTDGL